MTRRTSAPSIPVAVALGLAAAGLTALPAIAASETAAKATFVDGKGKQIGRATLTEPAGGILIDDDGSTLITHAKPDDHRSQPSGNAGDRIACAVVRPGS